MLEEHIREVELQSQERLVEEQKRNKELLQRLEREKVLEVENYAIRLQSAERDLASSHRELTSLRSQIDRLKIDKSQLEQELFETQQSYTLLQKECTILGDSCKRAQEQADNERADNAHLVGELTKEVIFS
jgi:Rab11 family-interacting protein 3/4